MTHMLQSSALPLSYPEFGLLGIEPRLQESEPCVLPLYDNPQGKNV